MNAMPENIIVNSCQYTPVYLIQDPGASQGQSYYIAQSTLEESKPSDNLKSFYESSGNIENGFVNVNSGNKPRILKKQDSGVFGNNLKLASFLLPKNENTSKQHYVVNSVVLKPNVAVSNSTHTTVNSKIHTNDANNTNNPSPSTAATTSTVNTIHRLNMASKIVKLKDTTFNGNTKSRYSRAEKPSPKIKKPKELPPILQGAPSKHTSVQLLKLGETYHSLNQLSDEQMKMVSQALKMFGNPQKIAPEPAYDPVTNTKFIYKVVSPRDLTVVGKNKVFTKESTPETVIEGIGKNDHIIKSEPRKETATKEIKKEVKEVIKKESIVKDNKNESVVKDVKKDSPQKHETKKDNAIKKSEQKHLRQRILRELMDQEEMNNTWIETRPPKVTRSGRKVKLPKLIFPEGTTVKPKRQNTFVSCFQCSAEFPSLYRLQKHYQSHPTHVPAKIHANLFHCLLAIVKSGTNEDRTNIFVQQLEQLIVKLRSLLPCLLRTPENEGKSCTISDDVGRLLGVAPGRYNLDVEALNCVKNKDGYCDHSLPPKDPQTEENGRQCWITMNNEDIIANTEADTEDCARINSVEKWPTVSKRVWKQKKQKSQENAKRMRLISENDTLIELGTDNAVTLENCECPEEQSAIIINEQGAEQKADEGIVIKIECNDIPEQEVCANIVEEDPKNVTFDQQPQMGGELKNNAQFYSAHFDIRSSPIKPSSTTFRKFQINPDLLAKYEAQIIRSIETVDKDQVSGSKIPCPTVEEVLRTTENVLETSAEILKSNSSNELPIDTNIMQTNQNDLNTLCRGVLHMNENGLQSSQDILHNDNDVLTSQDALRSNSTATNVLTNDDTLQEIFRDEDLSAVKESFILDRELKDWILNRSNDDKSEDGFSRSTALIEPALLHVKDDEIKPHLDISQKDLTTNDNHDDSSVLNFLDTLATDCLAYPGTEIRTNNGDFQLDLFSFHSS